jgi:hypothetical protein
VHDLDELIQVVAVDDGTARSRTLDGEVTDDVEVAGGIRVLAGARDRQVIGPARKFDRAGRRWELAAMMADRSEMWPVASFQLKTKFTPLGAARMFGVVPQMCPLMSLRL